MYSDQDRFNFKNTSILRTITAADSTNVIDIYSPAWISDLDSEGTRYSGFITFLTATIEIKSLEPTVIPPIPETALPEDINKILDAVASLSQYRQIRMLSRFEGQTAQEVCNIPLFRQDPFYRVSLMPFWAGTNNTVDVGCNEHGAGEVLSLQLVTPLQGGDRIFIRGSVIERATWKPPRPKQPQVAYASHSREVGSAPTVVLAGNTKRDNATFVNYSVVPPGGNWIDYVVWIRQNGEDQGPGKPISPHGGSLEVNVNNYYNGPVWAYSNLSTQLSVEEGVRIAI